MTTDLLTIDGSQGEGGGQVLRTALALAVRLGRPVAVTGVRARRPRPGLQPQHLAVVRALAAISDAEVAGDALGSTEVRLIPRGLWAGEYRFDVSAVRPSAGSVTLLFQALLLPLAVAPGPSRLTLLGGTHVPWSPPVPYLADVFLPALGTVGLAARVELGRWGWFPAGGGELRATVAPGPAPAGFRPGPRDPGEPVTGLSAASGLPGHVAVRQAGRAAARLAAAGLPATIRVEPAAPARSPGSLLFLALRGRAGAAALGRRGWPAERVADAAVDDLLAFRDSGAAVDEHLADQLLPFLALAREPSAFTCPALSSHLRTVAAVVRQLGPAAIDLEAGPPAGVRVTPGAG